MNITPFGKKVREYRMDLNVKLKDMAEELAVTSAYLSAVETGKKDITESLANNVVNYFQSRGIAADRLYELADQTRKELRLKSENYDDQSWELASAFARKLPDMDEEKKAEIWKLLDKD